MRKPDPAIYRLVCDELGVEPGEAVFLDDLGINLKPARAMGMATIKVTDPDEAIGGARGRRRVSPALRCRPGATAPTLTRQAARAARRHPPSARVVA